MCSLNTTDGIVNTISTKKSSKRMTSNEKILKHAEIITAWGCFDENIPSHSLLQSLCRDYEKWAYEQMFVNGKIIKSILPSPKEWVTNKDAMIEIKKNKISNLNTLEFIDYINCLDDKNYIKNAKTGICNMMKLDHSHDMEYAKAQSEKHWLLLQHGHTLGAQIIRELRENKKMLTKLLEECDESII